MTMFWINVYVAIRLHMITFWFINFIISGVKFRKGIISIVSITKCKKLTSGTHFQ